MARDKYTFDGVVIAQPDADLGYSWETIYGEDATRAANGPLCAVPMFTVEALSYKRTGLTTAELKTILRIIVGRNFTVHYFSGYHDAWRNDTFYVGKGDYAIGEIDPDTGLVSSLSFQMTGVNPIA